MHPLEGWRIHDVEVQVGRDVAADVQAWVEAESASLGLKAGHYVLAINGLIIELVGW